MGCMINNFEGALVILFKVLRINNPLSIDPFFSQIIIIYIGTIFFSL
jgi:hypothetical protein